jgi:hypothetical protein
MMPIATPSAAILALLMVGLLWIGYIAWPLRDLALPGASPRYPRLSSLGLKLRTRRTEPLSRSD